MAKTSFTILLAFFLVLVLSTMVIYGEPQNPETRSKARSKLTSAIRKKKNSVTKPKLELTTVINATTTVAPEFNDAQFNGVQGSTKVGETNDPVMTTPPSTTRTPTEITTKNVLRRANNSPQRSELEGCGDCDQENCAVLADTTCPNGLVLDRCSCCFVCGALEGNRCYNSSLNLPYNPDVVGNCGPHLDCLLREDLEPTESREALCECRDKRAVCGNDHKTYSTECKLREAAHSNPRLSVTSWSPCVSAPVMTTPVENVTVAIGKDVSLSCEVRAYPAPILHWEFLSEGKHNEPLTALPQILPGDDSGIVVVVRGSESSMTTSWIQIIDVTPKRQGTYFCIAKNNEGTIQNSATLRVYKSLDDE